MDRRALAIAAGIGAVAQLVLVGVGHFVPFVADNLFAVGGVALSAVAGAIYARRTAERPVSAGGAAAGGLCAVVGIAVSAALGDVPWTLVVFGGLASAAGGLAGAVVERRVRGRAAAKP